MPKRTNYTVAKTPEDLAKILDLPTALAREWRVQLELLQALRRIMQRERLTHDEVATRAKTSRTRITAILNGKLKHVTSDLLIRVLSSLGYSVKVSVTKDRKAA